MTPLIDGAAFVLDAPEHVPAVWGDGEQVLWSKGEPLLIAGPPGVGKSTLAQRLALVRCGASESLDVLGATVTPDVRGRVLYVAADRPQQVARSMRRMVRSHHRKLLEDRLVVWAGPLLFSVTDEPAALARWALENGTGTLVLDSLYNVFGDLADGKVGQAVGQALAACVAAEVEVVALHHPRKSQGDNKRPRTLDDLYGSTWITSASGSVVFLYGQAGDPVVEFLHLKQPAAEVGPFHVEHDTDTGTVMKVGDTALTDVLAAAGPDGLTAKQAAKLTGGSDSRAAVEKARRKLDKLVSSGAAESFTREGVGRWRVTCVTATVTTGTNGHAPSRTRTVTGHGTVTDLYEGVTQPEPPFRGEGVTERDAPASEAEEALIAQVSDAFDATEVHPDANGGGA